MKIEIDSNDFGRRAILFFPNLFLTFGMMTGVFLVGGIGIFLAYEIIFPDVVITNVSGTEIPYLAGAGFAFMAFVFCLGLQFLGYIATMGMIVLENSKHRI